MNPLNAAFAVDISKLSPRSKKLLQLQEELYNAHQEHENVSIGKKKETAFVKNAETIYAIGDLEGNLPLLLDWLIQRSILSKDSTDKFIWTNPNLYVVQCGDQIDRSRMHALKPEHRMYRDVEMMIFTYLLNRMSNGRFINIIGNHELMNIKNDFNYALPNISKDSEDNKDRIALIKSILETRNFIVSINDILFSHAGISDDVYKKYISNENIVETINTIGHGDLISIDIRKVNNINNDDFVLWNRSFNFDNILDSWDNSTLKMPNIPIIKQIIGHNKIYNQGYQYTIPPPFVYLLDDRPKILLNKPSTENYRHFKYNTSRNINQYNVELNVIQDYVFNDKSKFVACVDANELTTLRYLSVYTNRLLYTEYKYTGFKNLKEFIDIYEKFVADNTKYLTPDGSETRSKLSPRCKQKSETPSPLPPASQSKQPSPRAGLRVSPSKAIPTTPNQIINVIINGENKTLVFSQKEELNNGRFVLNCLNNQSNKMYYIRTKSNNQFNYTIELIYNGCTYKTNLITSSTTLSGMILTFIDSAVDENKGGGKQRHLYKSRYHAVHVGPRGGRYIIYKKKKLRI